MTKKILVLVVTTILFISSLIFLAMPQAFCQGLKTFKSTNTLQRSKPNFDRTKKTIIIPADNSGTDYGLTLFPTDDYKAGHLHELHVIDDVHPAGFADHENIVHYSAHEAYPIDVCWKEFNLSMEAGSKTA